MGREKHKAGTRPRGHVPAFVRFGEGLVVVENRQDGGRPAQRSIGNAAQGQVDCFAGFRRAIVDNRDAEGLRGLAGAKASVPLAAV